MSVMLLCLLITLIMPIIAKAPLAYAMHKTGKYDNRHPRSQQQQLTGFGARTLAAHQNCFEAISYFAPAAVTVIGLGAIDSTAKQLAIAFVIARIVYLFSYWFDYDKVRSIAWIIGFGCSITLIVRLLVALN